MKKTGSGWKLFLIVGAVLGSCGCGCGGLLSLALIFGNSYGTRIKLKNGNELYYTAAVTEQEAQKLAKYMEDKWLDDKVANARFQLNKTGETYEFRAVVKEGKEKDEDTAFQFRVLAMLLSMQVFDGAPVEVHLCNDSLKTVRTLEWQQEKKPSEKAPVATSS
jgi:hypothetical protein